MCPGRQFGDFTYCNLFWRLIGMIIIAPFVFLLGPILFGFCAPWAILCNRDCPCLCNFILFAIALPLGTALGIIAAALLSVFGTVPFMLI